MKKLLSLILVFLMLVSICSCAGTNDNNDVVDTVGSSAEAGSSEQTTAENDITYDGVFQAGFGREDITPEVPISLNDGKKMTSVRDPLYATAVALSDGDETILIITADIKNMSTELYLKLTKQIKMITKVPEQNIMFSATHNHSAPTPSQAGGAEKVLRTWTAQLLTDIVNACKAAIADLSDAEIYIGTFKTTGMAFVRRYFTEDGQFRDIMTLGSAKAARYESEADDTAQMLRFVRKEKKDILLTNWQCHVASMIGIYGDKISADLVGFYRDIVEKGDDDLLVAYYQGASGNINASAPVSGTAIYMSYPKMCEGFGNMALEASAVENLTRVNAGKITAERKIYAVTGMIETAERIAQAKEARDAGYPSSLLTKYGFSHYREAEAVLMREGNAEKINIYLGIISLGDIAFTSVPYEMYDTNGMQVKDGSPAKMTFVLTCAGGSYAYVPSTFASKNGGYDAYKTLFEYGTGDEVAGVLVEVLKNQFNK